MLASTRKGKQILNVGTGDSGMRAGRRRQRRDHRRQPQASATSAEGAAEMPRGKGVRLQRFKDGGLADAKTFAKKEGLSYIDSAGRSFTLTDLRDWWGVRAQAGRMPPKGFPKSGKFGSKF